MSFILDALRRADAQRESDPSRGIHAQAIPPHRMGQADPLLPPSSLGRLLPWALALGVTMVAAAIVWRFIESARPADAVPVAEAPAVPSVRVAPAIAPPAPPPAAPAAPVSAPAPIAWPADAPPLVVSGGVYSAQAGQRMVIVNGQVHGEGAEPVPGARVEDIRPGAVVVLYRGQRFLLAY